MSNIKNPTRIQTANESLDNSKDLGFYSAIANSVKDRLEYLRQNEKNEKNKINNGDKSDKH